MKKTLLALFAAAAFVGCERSGKDMNEPAGADTSRDSQIQQTPSTNDTNTISDPSGASSDQSSGASSQPAGESSSSGASSSGTSSGSSDTNKSGSGTSGGTSNP